MPSLTVTCTVKVPPLLIGFTLHVNPISDLNGKDAYSRTIIPRLPVIPYKRPEAMSGIQSWRIRKLGIDVGTGVQEAPESVVRNKRPYSTA